MKRLVLPRACCWIVVLALGARQAWRTRFSMNPDGISYLDIGDAYWRHDWHNAVNAYWSPLYSWILGFFVNLMKPSTYWEYPLVHGVNFLIFVGALVCFEFFLETVIHAYAQGSASSKLSTGELPEFFWRILGYTLFLNTSLALNGLHLASPDLCVAGFVYLVAALLIKIRIGTAARGAHILLGFILALSSLAKAAMFPLSVVFFLAAFLCGGMTIASMKRTAVACISFLLIASPFVLSLSTKEGRFTFSSVGSVAYEVFVDGVDQFVPRSTRLAHPVNKLLDSPLTYEFSEPIAGTYPLWYDSSFWHEGIRPYFSVTGEKHIIIYGLAVYLYVFLNCLGVALVTLVVLLLVAPSNNEDHKRFPSLWPITIPPVAALVLYLIVYTEPRYVAPFCCVLLVLAFSRVRTSPSRLRQFLLAFVLFVNGLSAFYFVWKADLQFAKAGDEEPIYSSVAESLSRLGVQRGDKMAVIGPEPFGQGGAFVARLGRNRIVAETSGIDLSWMGEHETCNQYSRSVKGMGVKTVLIHGEPPKSSHLKVTRLSSGYYAVEFDGGRKGDLE